MRLPGALANDMAVCAGWSLASEPDGEGEEMLNNPHTFAAAYDDGATGPDLSRRQDTERDSNVFRPWARIPLDTRAGGTVLTPWIGPAALTEQSTKAASSRPAMIDRTFKIEEELVRRGETAVLRRAGGYTSMRAFVNGAFAAELARLEEAHNGGESFPPNATEFQRGRSFGS